jgi:3-deoxy-D-manno-octulosonic-acid transferase
MMNSSSVKAVFRLYDLCWKLAIPALRLNRRLCEGFEQRIFASDGSPAVDLWIQSASVGESYLTGELLNHLDPVPSIGALVTSNTSQGIQILEHAVKDASAGNMGFGVSVSYFPFDKPGIMCRAVETLRPKVMVLLETEIWPGLFRALKTHGCKIIIINGRMTAKSLNKYLMWPSFWRRLAPDKILAVSEGDAERFGLLFGTEKVDLMPNMKFDRIGGIGSEPHPPNPLRGIFPAGTSLLVLGSVRQEEEPSVQKIILDIHRRLPEIVFGLFPRHMHRVKNWKKILNRLSIPWVLRSESKKQVPSGTVVLWDNLGELSLAYALSKAAFVGGSLAPLGGQNFLEALTAGIVPVIGPSWENFAWVGREILEKGLVCIAPNWREAADKLVENMTRPRPQSKVRQEILKYVKARQGGTVYACRTIEKFLNNR